MKLPELPRKLNKKEAKITPLIIAWFERNWHNSVALEIKVGKNKILPHQQLALEEVQKGNFSWKIPDMGKRNPFDGFILKNADAFLVVCNGHQCEAKIINSDYKIKFNICAVKEC